MVFALILLIAVAIAFFVSPLIAIILFILGAIGFVLMFGLRRSDEEGGTASADPGARAARKGRQEARDTRIR